MTGWRADVRVLLLPISAYSLTLVTIAMLGGGWLALGRVDPLLAVPGAGWAAVVAIWAMRGRPIGWALVVSAGSGAIMLGVVLLADAMDGLRGGEWMIAVIALFASAQITAAVAQSGARLAGTRRWAQRLLAFIGLPLLAMGWTVLAWPIVEGAYRVERPPEQRPRVAWLTSLPVGRLGSTGLTPRLSSAELTLAEDPVAQLLAQTTRDRRLVTVDAAALGNADVLLLAHPPALDPAQLVAIDDWVRGGGRAMVFADGLSSWPASWPLGDPRNPPVTSMLGALLAHWGLDLAAPEGLAESRIILRDSGQRLELLSAGRFRNRDSRCIVRAQGLIAECRIGRGHALLVADADLLAPQLWAGRQGASSSVDWRSGNMLWLLDKLGGDASRAFAAPSWSKRREPMVEGES